MPVGQPPQRGYVYLLLEKASHGASDQWQTAKPLNHGKVRAHLRGTSTAKASNPCCFLGRSPQRDFGTLQKLHRQPYSQP